VTPFRHVREVMLIEGKRYIQLTGWNSVAMSEAGAVMPNSSTGKCLTCDCHCEDN